MHDYGGWMWFLIDVGLVDCFRRRCPDRGHYTWYPAAAWAFAANTRATASELTKAVSFMGNRVFELW